jgi:trk system potassium uptake protein TrkA
MEVATGKSVLSSGDRVVVIGSPASVADFADDITAGTKNYSDDIVIVGASQIGFQVVREFASHGYHPRLIEQNHERARDVAEVLPHTTVLERDATDIDFLEREHIDEADILISALDIDEGNLLMALLGRRLGADRTVVVVEDSTYSELFEAVGVDVTVNPREEVAEEIIRFTRTDRPEKIVMLEHDQAEVIEIEATRDSILAGRQIAESMADLPDGVVIGAISREGDLVTPRGTTEIRPGDHIVIVVDANVLDEVVEAI